MLNMLYLLPKLPLIQQEFFFLALTSSQLLIAMAVGKRHPHLLEALELEVVSMVMRPT